MISTMEDNDSSHNSRLKQKSPVLGTREIRDRVWVAPPQGWSKVNVGTWLFHSEGKTGIGLIHPDANGSPLESRVDARRGLLTLLWKKSYAIQEALAWIDRRSLEQVIIESDNPVVTDIVRCCSRPDEAGLLASTIRVALQHRQDTRIETIPKECNKEAMDKAKEAPE